MNWPTDTLAGLYLFLFVFGFIFSLVSLLLGAAHGQLHLPDGHHGHAGHADGAPLGHGGEVPVSGPSPINISTIMIFCTWFGATGYILRVYYGALAGWSLLVATLVGLAGAAIVYAVLAKVIWRGQTALDPRNYEPVGALARVSSPIRPGGTGEIVYLLDGKQQVDGARALEDGTLLVGSTVEIVRREGGLAYVRPWIPASTDGPFLEPDEPLSLPPPGMHHDPESDRLDLSTATIRGRRAPWARRGGP